MPSVGALLIAVGLLASCGNRTPVAQTPASVAPETVPAAKVASPVASTTAPKPAALPAATSSGDPVLDAMDHDLTAFEKESAGLDSAAAASQEPTK
jgi:hypothetical protein